MTFGWNIPSNVNWISNCWHYHGLRSRARVWRVSLFCFFSFFFYVNDHASITCCFSVAFLLPPCFAALSIACVSTCSENKNWEKKVWTVREYRFIISNGSSTGNVCLVVLVCVFLFDIGKKYLWEAFIWQIPLECEARQCYNADDDDSLSPLTFSGEWSESSRKTTTHWLFHTGSVSMVTSLSSIHCFDVYSFILGRPWIVMQL